MREPASEKSVKGELFTNGSYFCLTLERPEVMIPRGTYPVKMLWSEHFQQNVPHILNVPGRSAIEMHYGDFPADTKGCVLVGYRDGDDSISQSRDALADLCKLLEDDDSPSSIQITE